MFYKRKPKKGEIREVNGRVAQWSGEVWIPIEPTEAYPYYRQTLNQKREYTPIRRFYAVVGFIHLAGYFVVGTYLFIKFLILL